MGKGKVVHRGEGVLKVSPLLPPQKILIIHQCQFSLEVQNSLHNFGKYFELVVPNLTQTNFIFLNGLDMKYFKKQKGVPTIHVTIEQYAVKTV